MKATNNHKATITLGLVSLGFAVSYPFGQTFVGGLVASGCSAAMVGGLADWFAVSALFRRPLGIPFRTEIIPRNRERIAKAIIDMVEQELLTKENIRETLNRYDLAALLVRYLTYYGGKMHIKEFLRRIGDDTLAQISPEKLGQYMAELVKANAAQIRLAPPLAQALAWSLKHGYVDELTDFVIQELSIIIEQPPMRNLLVSLFDEARLVYEKDMGRRKLAGQIIEGLGVTSAGVASLVQNKVREFLGELKDRDNPFRVTIRQKVGAFADKLAHDPVLQSRIEEWKTEYLVGRPELANRFTDFVRAVLGAATTESGKAVVHKWIGTQVDRLIIGFRQNDGQQQAVGAVLKQALMALIDTYHAQIGTIVRERLSQFSTAALVEFIETRVGNDLQMIRINGSIVGGLAGMLIFVLSHWL